uniref:Cleavage and polyadenylation specific factor 1 n=1 Tax=Melopsittacus undulatus TaxID=13146 RepID=A0A8V5GUA3_MELUD
MLRGRGGAAALSHYPHVIPLLSLCCYPIIPILSHIIPVLSHSPSGCSADEEELLLYPIIPLLSPCYPILSHCYPIRTRRSCCSIPLSLCYPIIPLIPMVLSLCYPYAVIPCYPMLSQCYPIIPMLLSHIIPMLSLLSHSPSGCSADEEELLLYGASGAPCSPAREEPRGRSCPERESESPDPTHWCLVAREGGSLEIYHLPEWRLVFLVKNFPMGQRVLVDSSFGHPVPGAAASEPGRQGELPMVKELLLVGLGHRRARPYLLAHVDQELLIYEAFSHDSQLGQNNLKVRFKKVPHNIHFRERKPKGSRKKPDAGEELGGPRPRLARFRPFQDIYGYSGVFICGPCPHWLLVTSRGALRLHPMSIDGAVDSFAPFHNVNCPKGFLYFNRQGELRISVLPACLSYDAPWPVRKIPLRCTPHYVVYHLESKVYAVATSVINSCTRIPRMTGEEKEFESIERDDRYVHPQQEAFSIQLISPVSWETIPNTRIDLDEWEHVTCMKTVSLRSEETVSGLKGYVAVGTCLMQGEEVTCRGRIFLWSLKDHDLTGMAFIDTQLYIHRMISVKNFILAADLMKSISLLRYQEESKTLSLVSRDAKPLEVYSVDFMVDSTQLGFLVSDRDQNLLVYMYLPEAKESLGGLRLLRRADFHVGSRVNVFWRTRCRGGGERRGSAWDQRHVTWFATLDGGLGLLLPMQEKPYRRLLMLQNALSAALPQLAGLNPRAYRLLQCGRRVLQNAVRNVLDGELLGRFLLLSTMERGELAKKIGTTPEIILDDLLEIDRVTAHF